MKTTTALTFLLSACSLGSGFADDSKTLRDVVAERAFPEYRTWWPLGNELVTFMSDAIVSEWKALPGNDGSLEEVQAFVSEYVTLVYAREPRAGLVEDFAAKRSSSPMQSGEFDALSYGFFRSAFTLIERRIDEYEHDLTTERRRFTERVGKRFFESLETRLALKLPAAVEDAASFAALKTAIDRTGDFLLREGYYRDHVRFRFDVSTEYRGRRIDQPESDFLKDLNQNGTAYALFEMGYPVILPSAVYLFHTIGEAQHHSSRTMEELFRRSGLTAHETHDFDPIGYPSDMVVELWEVRRTP